MVVVVKFPMNGSTSSAYLALTGITMKKSTSVITHIGAI